MLKRTGIIAIALLALGMMAPQSGLAQVARIDSESVLQLVSGVQCPNPNNPRNCEDGELVLRSDYGYDVTVELSIDVTPPLPSDALSVTNVDGWRSLICFEGSNSETNDQRCMGAGGARGVSGKHRLPLYAYPGLQGDKRLQITLSVYGYESVRNGELVTHVCEYDDPQPSGCSSRRTRTINVDAEEATTPQIVDPSGTLSVNNVEVEEGDRANFTITFTPFVSDEVYTSFTGSVETADADAVAGTDYRAVSRTLSFNSSSGTQTKSFSVSTIEDSIYEPNTKTFDVNLSTDVVGIEIRNGFGVIKDDDEEPDDPGEAVIPEIRGSPDGGLRLTEGESGTLSFRTCRPDGTTTYAECDPIAPQGTARVQIGTSEGTGARAAQRSPSDGCPDYSVDDRTLSISGTSPRTVNLEALWDSCHNEGVEQFSITLDNPSSNVTLAADTYLVLIDNFKASMRAESPVNPADGSNGFKEGETVEFKVLLDRYAGDGDSGRVWLFFVNDPGSFCERHARAT